MKDQTDKFTFWGTKYLKRTLLEEGGGERGYTTVYDVYENVHQSWQYVQNLRG